MLPYTPKAQTALRSPIHITTNPTGVFIRYNDTKFQ